MLIPFFVNKKLPKHSAGLYPFLSVKNNSKCVLNSNSAAETQLCQKSKSKDVKERMVRKVFVLD